MGRKREQRDALVIQRSRLGLGIASAAMLLEGCNVAEEDATELVLANRYPVQSAYVGWAETGTAAQGKGVHLVKAWATGRKAKSVGAIRPQGEKWAASNTEGNCGATFISDRHAITAAHCVDKDNLPNVYVSSSNRGTPFRIEQINTSNLNIAQAQAQTYVTGTWPNWNRTNPLTPSEGYSPVTYTCYVRVRCDSASGHGRDNCPSSFTENGVNVVEDIALVVCPWRSSAGNNWSAVASSLPNPQTNQNVEVWWFHEVVNLATSAVNNQYQPTSNWEHYLYYDSGASDNYHYRNDLQNHQLLPLVSYRDASTSSTPSLYKITGSDSVSNGSSYTPTNVPVCHGTSGSGVFKSSAWDDSNPQFLGPMVYGPGIPENPHRLCDTMNVVPGATLQSEYASLKWSQKLQALSYVTADRCETNCPAL